MKIHSIDRASRLASRAVASSSTNDERGRFPINRQSHSSDPRHRTCAFSLSTRVGQVDHRSRLITDPPLSLPKYLSRRQKAMQCKHTPGRTDRSIDRDPTETRPRPDRRRRHSRARRWRHDDDDDDDLDDDDDAVVGGVEERGETGGESSGERVGGIGTTRYARWDDDAR